MKKLFIVLLLLFTIHFSLFTDCFALGTTTSSSMVEYSNGELHGYRWTITFTADASNGAIVSAVMTAAQLLDVKDHYLYQAEFDTGGTAPTTLFDIAITGLSGIDLAQTKLSNIDTTATGAYVKSLNIMVMSLLTVTFSNNIVNSATGTLYLDFVK